MVSSHLNALPACVFSGSVCVMAELPSGLLEACVVVGAPSDKLRDIYQVYIYICTHIPSQAKPCAVKVCKQTEVHPPFIHLVSTLTALVDYLYFTY